MREFPSRRPARSETVGDGLSSPGESLDARTRDRLEEGFGRDLGEVRVHDGAEAARSARRVGARAYTVGPDIVFGPGGYRPDDAEGWRLLSHEIAHVVQQRSAPPTGAEPRPAGESRERAARGAADALVRGEPAPELEASGGRELARDELTIEDFEEPETEPAASPPDDEDAGLLTEQATPFSAQVSAADPSVIFVPVDATRETIARELGVDVTQFHVVGATEAPPPDPDRQGIRFYEPEHIPAALTGQIRTRLEAALPVDVQATVDALVAESGGWMATQYALRWMQYSRYRDAAGRGYLDRYLDDLDRRTIISSRNWLFTTTSSERSALAELLAETSADVHAAVLRVRGRSARAESGDVKTLPDGPLPLFHVVGRWVSGQDTEAVPAMVAGVLMSGIADREEAEIRVRNAKFMGAKVMIAGSDGLWYGYGIYTQTTLSGKWPPPVVGGAEENGRFYWYYPSVVYLGPGETDPNGPADKPESKLLQTQLLADALAGPDLRAVISLDYGALRAATNEQRLEIFRRFVAAGFSDTRRRGYEVDDAVQTMARTLLVMPPRDFVAFERGLDAAGITAKLIATKDARFMPLGAAFTFQTMAGTDLGPGSFADPIELRQGTADIATGLDYYQADVQPPPVGAAGTMLSFEHGSSATAWGDTPAWSQRTRYQTRPVRPTELVSVETVTPTGAHTRIASAFEAALTQGDPEGQVSHEAFMGFLNVVMLTQGGLGALRLGGIGMRAIAAGSLRAAMRVLATELATEAGKQALRSVVDLALFTAARYAADHQEELEKTTEGRAFLAVVAAATALLAARDVGALVESGAVERLIVAGRRVLTVVSEGARVAIRRLMLNFRAARLAWDALKREGLVAATNIGGFTMLRPTAPKAFLNMYRVGQAQAAGEELMATLGSGKTAERAGATLGRLEKAAGKFVRPKGAPAHTEAELEAAKAYRDMAQHLSGLGNKQRVAVLDALDQLIANAKRRVPELVPFIRAALKAGRADVVAYLNDVTWLSTSGISSEGFARLGKKALGKSPVDLGWLRGLKPSPKDLDDLALNPDTAWTSFREASLNPTDRDLLKKAWRDLRGHAAEVVAGEEAAAGRLAPGYRVSGKHVVTPGGSEIDLELTSTGRDGSKRLAEVKGWTPRTWKRSLDAYEKDPTALSLTDTMDRAGSRQVKKMLKQLTDAGAATPRGELPILAVTEKLPAAERAALKALVAGKAEVVYLPEAAITKVSGRLAKMLGIR